jgi:integrase
MDSQTEVVQRIHQLRNLLSRFMAQVEKSISLYRQSPNLLSNDELAKLALRIWELRHFTEELLTQPVDETTRYNIAIILRVIDQPIFQQLGFTAKTTSLIAAADRAKKEHRPEELKHLIRDMISHSDQKETLFDDLRDIARELSA